MFLAGDEFGNTQFGNNNSYCQDNEISWLDWRLLEKNRDLFEFFKFMIAYRNEHKIIRKKLPNAMCGMETIHMYNIHADGADIAKDAKTFSVGFAGYDWETGKDDLVCMSINTHWEDVEIHLPDLKGGAHWYLSVNTSGDGQGRYCYPEGQEVRIDGTFILRPRSVAIFTGRTYW